jgi:protein TonB
MMIGIAETDAVSGPAVILPADPDLRDRHTKESRIGRLRRGAIILAALVHGAILAAVLLDFPLTFAPPPAPPPAIPVQLVKEVPPPPAPQPKPAPTPPQHFYDLRSGPDQETTAPPSGETKGAEAAPKPEPPPPTQAEAPEPAQPKPPHPSPPASPKPKEAARETAPKPEKHVAANIRPGEKERSGDPYLNAISARLEQHRSYPASAVGPYGLRLEGVAVYEVGILPTGALAGMRLARSSGSPVLDETARQMIVQSAPFPPLPNNYPRNGVVITWTVPVYPPEP